MGFRQSAATRLLINKHVKGGTKCLLALLLVGTQLAAVGFLAFMFYDCTQDVQLAYIDGDNPGVFHINQLMRASEGWSICCACLRMPSVVLCQCDRATVCLLTHVTTHTPCPART